MRKITGHTGYKGYTAMQHFDFQEVFIKFLQEHEFDRILEIGTASGGMTLFLRDALPNAEVLSYDINEVKWYSEIRQNNIDIRVQNIFDENIHSPTIPANITDDYALNFIKNAKKLLVLCDGGNKVAEFNCIAKYLKSGASASLVIKGSVFEIEPL